MRRLVILGFVILLLGGSVSATETRVLTMGENNLVVLDEANIWLFPSRVFEYPNLAVAEFGDWNGFVTDDFTHFGIHWKVGSDNPLVLGTYFTTLPAEVPDNLLGGGLVPFDFGVMDNRRITLFYGNGLSTLNLGTRFSYVKSGRENNEQFPAVDESKESFGYFDLAFGVTAPSGQWDLALGVAFGSWTDEDAAGQTETEPDGFMDFSVTGRYFMQRGPDYTLVPHAGVIYKKRGIKDYVAGDGDPATLDITDNYTLTGFDLGIGANYTPAANVLAVFDIGFELVKWKDEIDQQVPAVATSEQTISNLVLPYFKIGLDADVFKWMDIRLGATSYWNQEKFEDAGLSNENKFSFVDNDTYLGFGFHWKRLHVDTYTDPEMFLQGFEFISGNGDVDMNFRISAVYEMF